MSTHRSAKLSTLALALVLVLSSCGSDDTTDNAASTPATTVASNETVDAEAEIVEPGETGTATGETGTATDDTAGAVDFFDDDDDPNAGDAETNAATNEAGDAAIEGGELVEPDGGDTGPVEANPNGTETVTEAIDAPDTAPDDDPDTPEIEQGAIAPPADTDNAVGTEPALTVGDDGIEEFLGLAGLTNPADAAECVRAEAASENFEITSATTDALLVAAIRCRTDELTELMFGDFADLDTSSIAANPEQITCAFGATLDWISELPLAEASVFDANEAPPEAIARLVSDCGISESDADFLLNDA